MIDCWHFSLASFHLLLAAVANVDATESRYLTKRGRQQNADAAELWYLTKKGRQR